MSGHGNLHTLNPCGNKITQIMPGYIPLSVTKLDVSNNSITELEDFSSHTNLHTLNIEYNNITQITPRNLPLSVTKLDVSYNSIKEVGDFSGHTNLHTLNLENNPVTVASGLPVSFKELKINGRVCVLGENCFHQNNFAVLKKAIDTSSLIQPPPEVFKRGFDAVRAYYEEGGMVTCSQARYS